MCIFKGALIYTHVFHQKETFIVSHGKDSLIVQRGYSHP